MASRRTRRISVDGREYRWTVRRLDPRHVAVRAWLDRPGRGRQLVVTVRVDDFWLHFGEIVTAVDARGPEALDLFDLEPVAPALTAGLLRAALAAGWQPEEVGGPVRFTMAGPRSALQLVAG
ncbi:hypothetical protein ABT095_34895 [Kitasatospora sp. NPDC002227]|uniref:hypothetical protein n=1 Tax=Kitasatospora sp. NPDC002227 TaxID=3154773 RepID=UPI0033238FDC